MTHLNPTRPQQKTFRGIQVLRGFAAVIVVLFHATLFWWRIVGGETIPSTPTFWWNGSSGVDLFFVISGFVMTVSTFGRERQPHFARRFLERRFIRLLPMYWIMTGFFALEYLVLNYYPVLRTTGEHFRSLTPGFLPARCC